MCVREICWPRGVVFRQHGMVKHRTIANLSRCAPAEIQAIKLALRRKGDLTTLVSLRDDVTLCQGSSLRSSCWKKPG